MSTLLVYATAREGESVVGRHATTLEIGVGKVAASISLTAALAAAKPDAVVLIGVCGAYPSRHLRAGLQALDVLDTCVAASELLVDDGVLTPQGFLDLGHLELGEVGPIPCDPVLSGKIAAVLACRLVTAATVSSAAGIDALSQAYALRSGAQIESLEGAAAAAACRRFGVPFAELRVVSNRTGDRDKGGWALDGALARLADATGRLLDAGVLP